MSAGIIGDDNRTNASFSQSEYASIIFLTATNLAGSVTSASGIALSPRTVLTVSHALDDQSGNFTNVSYKFYSEFQDLANFSSMVSADSTAVKLIRPYENNTTNDMALVNLNQNLELDSSGYSGLISFSDVSMTSGMDISTAGFPGDLGNKLYQARGKVTNSYIDAFQMNNTVDVSPGQSGSPVFTDYEGNKYVLGIVKSANSTGNISVRFTHEEIRKIFSEIEQQATTENVADLPTNALIGGNLPDTILGTHRRDNLYGESGTDRLDAYKGDDKIDGGEGDDQIFGSLGNDGLIGGSGLDLIDGGMGDDTISGGLDGDWVILSPGVDTIVDADSSDSLFIRVGSLEPFNSERATLNAIHEKDNWGVRITGAFTEGVGGWGLDTYLFKPTTYPLIDNDFVYGVGKSEEYVPLFRDPISQINFRVQFIMEEQNMRIELINLPDYNIVSTLIVQNWEAGDLGIEFVENYVYVDYHNYYTRKFVSGGYIFDLPVALISAENGSPNLPLPAPPAGSFLPSIFVGSADSDSIIGSLEDDELFGEGGDDVITALAGDDILHGGSGSDYIDGGDGEDSVYYLGYVPDPGVYDGVIVDLDTGVGSRGDALGDVISDVENVVGSYMSDVIVGSSEDNKIFAETGNDEVHGGDGNDLLIGGGGHDVINGGSGDDVIEGNAGDDLLSGGEGDDTLYSEDGTDTLEGGQGIDKFYITGLGNRVISDFDHNNEIVATDLFGNYVEMISSSSESNGNITFLGASGYLTLVGVTLSELSSDRFTFL